MNAFNSVTSAIFDVILAPFGHGPAGFDLLVWPILGGIIALIVYKYASNQKGIERAKDQIKMHLYEVRLYRHDMLVVLGSTVMIFLKNFIYVGHNVMPMLVMAPPMLTVMFQLEANYAFAPSEVGSVELLEVQLQKGSDVKATDIQLQLPAGVALEAPPVRTPDGFAAWRLRAETAGDHELTLVAGDHTLVKGWAVGGDARKVPIKRTRHWTAILYPGEEGIPADSPFYSAELGYPERELAWIWDGEAGILMWFLVLSLVAGFALRKPFGVTF